MSLPSPLSVPSLILARARDVAGYLRTGNIGGVIVTGAAAAEVPATTTQETYDAANQGVNVEIPVPNAAPIRVVVPPSTLDNANTILAAAILQGVALQENRHLIGGAGEPPFQNLWVARGGAYLAPGYWKDALGLVHLDGELANGGAAAPPSVMFTLPVGYRPPSSVTFPVWTGAAAGEVTVTAAGAVTFTAIAAGAAAFVGLSGFTFRT